MDFRIIGIGIAITFAIIALSAITLYLAFRVKETFREEKSFKMQFVKMGFILGILFLAGGLFYFFAQAMNQPEGSSNDTLVPDTQMSARNASIALDVSYPDNVKNGEIYTISFKIYNPSSITIYNSTIELLGLGLSEVQPNLNEKFNVLNFGDVGHEERSGYFQLKAPSQPTQLEGELIFQSKDTEPSTKKINIAVIGKNGASPTATPTPTPTPTATPTPTPTVTPTETPTVD